MKNVLIATIATSAAMLSSCSMDFPKTRAEFTEHPRIQKETYTVPRKLDAVITSLDKQARSCIISESVETRMGGGGLSTSRTRYNMTVRKTSASRGELTYRQSSNDTIGQPEGGFFMLAADLQARHAVDQRDALPRPSPADADQRRQGVEQGQRQFLPRLR
jgi:hypothetical protein